MIFVLANIILDNLKDNYKANRCLARYSPRATTTNRAKTEILGPKKEAHFLILTMFWPRPEKNCSKKKSAFAQIIKGGNVILGDFLG